MRMGAVGFQEPQVLFSTGITPETPFQCFVCIGVTLHKIKVGLFFFADSPGLVNNRFSDVQRDLHEPVFVSVEQVARLDGQTTDRHGRVKIEKDSVAVRDDRTWAKNLESRHSPLDASKITASYVGNHPNGAKLLQSHAEHVSSKATPQAVGTLVLGRYHDGLGGCLNPVEQFVQALWLVAS